MIQVDWKTQIPKKIPKKKRDLSYTQVSIGNFKFSIQKSYENILAKSLVTANPISINNKPNPI